MRVPSRDLTQISFHRCSSQRNVGCCRLDTSCVPTGYCASRHVDHQRLEWTVSRRFSAMRAPQGNELYILERVHTHDYAQAHTRRSPRRERLPVGKARSVSGTRGSTCALAASIAAWRSRNASPVMLRGIRTSMEWSRFTCIGSLPLRIHAGFVSSRAKQFEHRKRSSLIRRTRVGAPVQRCTCTGLRKLEN